MSEFAFADGATTPRKRPLQARSNQTVRAILDATLQVLERDRDALTTTRVAEVAGVSVGTLYQYFPNRDALLNGVFADHLEGAIGALEAAAAEVSELPPEEAASRAVRAFLAAKAERVASARLLNRVFGVGLLDDRPIIRAAAQRGRDVVTGMLARGGTPDAAIVQRAAILASALEGIVRAAIVEDPERLRDPAWIDEVVATTLAIVKQGSAAIPGG